VFRTLEDQANQRVKSIIAANSLSVAGAPETRSSGALAQADHAKQVATAHASAF
jgi:hypothetical protein